MIKGLVGVRKERVPGKGSKTQGNLAANSLETESVETERAASERAGIGCCLNANQEADAVEGCRGYHHGDLRRCLLGAARDLLAERGVPGTSLRAIARRAGVSNRAPYHHFPDKMSLLAEVAREGFTELGKRMAVHEEVTDPVERLRLLGREYVTFAVDFPTDFATMYWPELCDDCNFPDRKIVASPAYDTLVKAIAEVAGPGATEEELEMVAMSGWAAVHGLATLRAQRVLAYIVDGEQDESPIVEGVLESTHRMLVREAKRAGRPRD